MRSGGKEEMCVPSEYVFIKQRVPAEYFTLCGSFASLPLNFCPLIHTEIETSLGETLAFPRLSPTCICIYNPRQPNIKSKGYNMRRLTTYTTYLKIIFFILTRPPS